MDAPILVTVGPDVDPARLAGVGDNVTVERFVPQGLVFPHCRAVVAHAGAGTMLGALAAGLPQVLLPSGAEQFLNAAACAAAGAAEVAEYSPHAVRAAFDRLGDSHVAAARRLADQIAAMPTADETLEAPAQRLMRSSVAPSWSAMMRARPISKRLHGRSARL